MRLPPGGDLSPAECAAVLALAAARPKQQGSTADGTSSRNSEIRRLPRQPESEWLYRKLGATVAAARALQPAWNGSAACRSGVTALIITFR